MKSIDPTQGHRGKRIALLAVVFVVTLSVAAIPDNVSLAQVARNASERPAGGPEQWQVALLGDASVLNMRASPARSAEVVKRLANGTMLRNFGCRISGGRSWCEVALLPPKTGRGWVAQRYLKPVSIPVAPRIDYANPDGELPCSIQLGKPAQQCEYRVDLDDKGYATVRIALPSGNERLIEFRAGIPTKSNLDLEIVFERWGDVFLIRLGDAELYEIPSAVIFGE